MTDYQATILADNPLHYWRFAAPSGTTELDLGSDPVFVGAGYLYGIRGYAGPAGDGGSCYIAVVTGSRFSSVVSRTHTFTGSVEAWVWPIGVLGVGQNIYCNDGVTAGTPFIKITAANKWQFSLDNAQPVSTANYTPQAWTYIAGTHDGTTGRLYINGSLVASVAGSSAGTYTAGFAIGSDLNNASQFQGFISEVAHYTGTLTPTQIANHFAAADRPSVLPFPQPFNSSGGGSPGSTADLTKYVAETYSNAP